MIRNEVTRRPVIVPVEVAEKASRVFKAYRMKADGASWPEIAGKLGYDSVAACAAEVRAWLDEAELLVSEFTKSQMLQLELDRLDEMQYSIYNEARSGNLQAIDRVIKLIEARAKMAGLSEEGRAAVQQTVVVAGDNDSYIESLRRAVDDRG